MSDSDNFNVGPILLEIKKVLISGLNDVFASHMERYEMLEKTHLQIMNLPSVQQQINTSDKNNFTVYNSNRDYQVRLLEDKIEKMSKRFDNFEKTLDILLNKLTMINVDLHKEKPKNIIKPSLEAACENENIKLEISENESEEEEDDDSKEVEESDEDEDKKESDKEEEEEEEESDEDESDEDESEKAEKAEEKESEKAEEDESEEDEDEDEDEDEKEESEEEEGDEASVETEKSDDVFEVEIKGEIYCTNDDINGYICELTDEGEQGDRVGYFKNKKAIFYPKK
jgi:cobalamin biosynthesis protein CobT